MKELSLNILDITQNSIRAEATLIEILLDETEFLGRNLRDSLFVHHFFDPILIRGSISP